MKKDKEPNQYSIVQSFTDSNNGHCTRRATSWGCNALRNDVRATEILEGKQEAAKKTLITHLYIHVSVKKGCLLTAHPNWNHDFVKRWLKSNEIYVYETKNY